MDFYIFRLPLLILAALGCCSEDSPPLNDKTNSVIEALSGTAISSSSSVLIAGNTMVSITCSAAAGKAESVEWLKDSKPLTPGDRVILSADKKNVTIIKVVKEDAGEYKCLLKNKVSKDESTYVMVINYGPESVNVNGKNAVTSEEPAELKCSADSVPPSIFSWKLNGTEINFSHAVLTIEKARVTDSGTYTCEAFNFITGMTKTTTHKLAVSEVGAADKGLSGGAIAGIVIGVLVAVIIIACIIKRKKQSSTDIPSPY